MLRAVPKNWFSWKFEIFDGEVCVANLDLPDGTPGFFFISAIQGRTFEIFLEEKITFKDLLLWKLDYDDFPILLREDGRTIASATKPSSFMETFETLATLKIWENSIFYSIVPLKRPYMPDFNHHQHMLFKLISLEQQIF